MLFAIINITISHITSSASVMRPVPEENRESGVSPERYRRCKRGWHTMNENSSLGNWEGGVCQGKRESEDLLGVA